MQEPQIKRLFCKPICKPDAAKPGETGETEPADRDVICPVRRGHCTRQRLPETPETVVALLITQRSRVQIPPPLPRPEALSRTEKGPLHVVVHGFVHGARVLAVIAVPAEPPNCPLTVTR